MYIGPGNSKYFIAIVERITRITVNSWWWEGVSACYVWEEVQESVGDAQRVIPVLHPPIKPSHETFNSTTGYYG
jgi:hypothetical protein